MRDPRSTCIVTHLPTHNGVDFNVYYRGSARDLRRSWATDYSSKRSCFAPRPVFPGATCLSALARGSRSTTASATGPNEVTGQPSFASCSSRSMRLARSLMAPLSVLTKMHRAEKGDPMQCSGTLSRRRFDQAPRGRRHQRPPAPRHDHGGPKARDDCRPRAARTRSWQGAHR